MGGRLPGWEVKELECRRVALHPMLDSLDSEGLFLNQRFGYGWVVVFQVIKVYHHASRDSLQGHVHP